MAFIQIIDFTTDDIDAVRKIDDEWEKATEGRRTARRQIATSDRNEAGHYMTLVFFDSYESAMENSSLPETKEFAERYRAATREMSFHDLDVSHESGL